MNYIKKDGFTLMELLVYMAIVGIVVVVAGEAFSNSTRFRVRTEKMIEATQEAESVAALFKNDLEQMGTKSAKEAGKAAGGPIYGDAFGEVHSSVYMDPLNDDYSSFLISTDTEKFSNIKFRRLRYDESGYYVATEEINWFVKDRTLKRTCKLLDVKTGFVASTDEPCAGVNESDLDTMDMATGVDSFKVAPATPSAVGDDVVQIFPPDPDHADFNFVSRIGDAKYVGLKSVNINGEVGIGGTTLTLSNFFSNYDRETQNYYDGPNQKINQVFAVKNETIEGTPVWSDVCTSFGNLTLEKNQEYEISFKINSPGVTDIYANDARNRSLAFVPGVDHMSVGFRSISTGDFPKVEGKKLIDDFFFFPPLDINGGSGTRSMRFTVSQKIEGVCLAFTFACFSPLVYQGKVSIEDLKVKKIASSSYSFSNPPFDAEAHKADKKNVKAMRLLLQVSRGAANGGSSTKGRSELIIPIPSNGPRD